MLEGKSKVGSQKIRADGNSGLGQGGSTGGGEGWPGSGCPVLTNWVRCRGGRGKGELGLYMVCLQFGTMTYCCLLPSES